MFGPTAGATIVRISVLGEPDRRPGQESHFAARRHGLVAIAKPGFEPALGLANAYRLGYVVSEVARQSTPNERN